MRRQPCPPGPLCTAKPEEAEHHYHKIKTIAHKKVDATCVNDHDPDFTSCYSAALTGPAGFWKNAEALADHIERGA